MLKLFLENKFLFKLLFSSFIILYSILRSFIFLYASRPNLVFGMGGYSSFPVCLSGYLLKIPIIIYENNLVIGRANKFLLPLSKKILVSNESIEGIKKKNAKSFTIDPNIFDAQRDIERSIGLKVTINNKKNNSGKLTIEYKNLEQLELLSTLLKNKSKN